MILKQMPKVVSITFARMGSSRFPGKILKDLGGQPVLKWAIDAAKGASLVDEVVLAVAVGDENDILCDLGAKYGVTVTRGSEENLLERLYVAALTTEADIVIFVESSNPLTRSRTINNMVARFLAAGPKIDVLAYHHWSGMKAKFHEAGVFTEACRFSALKRAHFTFRDPFDREHVIRGMHKRPDLYPLAMLPAPPHPDFKCDIDTATNLTNTRKYIELLGIKPERPVIRPLGTDRGDLLEEAEKLVATVQVPVDAGPMAGPWDAGRMIAWPWPVVFG